MTQNEVAVVLAWLFGYAQQVLRGFSWYNDAVTLVVSLCLGALGAFWVGGPLLADTRAFSFGAVSIAMQIVGGTAVATMAAHASNGRLAPKFNQFGAAADAAGPGTNSGGPTK